MVTVERATRLNARKEDIWSLFQSRDGQLLLSKGFLADLELIGTGEGSLRIMHLDGHWGGGIIKETVSRSNFDDGVIEYTILDTGGVVPFADYQGRIKIAPDGENRTIFSIRSTFIPVDMSEKDATAMSEKNIELLISNLRTAVADGQRK